MVSFEEDRVVFGEDCDSCLFEEYTEAVVAKGANAHQVMIEFGHNLGGGFRREERRRSHDAEERWGGPSAVRKRIWSKLGMIFAHGTLGVR